VDAKGTELVGVCKDELSQTSARIKLSDLNESWGDALTSLSSREETLRKGLALAENYQVSPPLPFFLRISTMVKESDVVNEQNPNYLLRKARSYTVLFAL
jgi:hypothetical protein